MSSSATDPKPVVTGYPAHAHPAAASSYPYHAPPPPSYYPNGAAPPPQPHYYPPAYAATAHPRYHNTFLRRLLFALVTFFIVLGLVILIIWLVLRPRLPEVSVSSFAVSGFNLSSSQLSGNFDVNLTFHNPNGKMGIYYDRVSAVVLYDSATLSETFLAPFYQWKGETTDLRARLVAAAAYVDPPDGARGINSDRARGTVNFHVRVLAWSRFRSGVWRTRWHVLRVYCDDVPIGFRNGTIAATTGSIVGATPRKCVTNI